MLGDVVYFKLTESKMGQVWRVGKVEGVKTGKDVYVRQVTIAYKDTSGNVPEDWIHRTVERPVRNVIKLFNIDETSLMDDIAEVHKMAKKYLDSEGSRFIQTSVNEDGASLNATIKENEKDSTEEDISEHIVLTGMSLGEISQMEDPDSWEVPDLDGFGLDCEEFVQHCCPTWEEQDCLHGMSPPDLGVFLI